MREEGAKWNVGQVITDVDMQRTADLADDVGTRAWEALVAERSTLAAASKVVIPLDAPSNEVSTGEPSRLAVGIPGPAGYVRVKRFRVVIGAPLANAADLTRVAITARTAASSNVGPFSANASGLPRADLIVARVRILGGDPLSRLVVDPETKQKSSQTIDLSLRATIDFQVIVGTPGAGTPAAPSDDLADGVYFVPIARVDLPDGYAPGTVITDNIPQLWPRGGVHRHTIAPAKPLIGLDAGATPAPEPSWSDVSLTRWCEFVHVVAGAKELSAPSDVGGIDWRNRAVRMTLLRALDHTGIGGVDRWPTIAAAKQSGASVSLDSGWRLTGDNTSSTPLWTIAAADLGTPANMMIYVDNTTGKLFVNFLGAPGTVEPQRYYLRIEASDRFIA